MIFNCFVLFQLFNELNARELKEKLWIFTGLQHNPMFIGIWVFTAVLQVVLVEYGGYALSCHFEGLTWLQWGGCTAVASLSLLWRVLLIGCPSRAFHRLESIDALASKKSSLGIRFHSRVGSRAPLI